MNCCKRGESKTEKAQIHYITLFMRLARKQREASFLPHFDQSLGESLKNGLFTVSLTVGVLRDHFEIRETTLFFSNSPQRQHFLNVVIKPVDSVYLNLSHRRCSSSSSHNNLWVIHSTPVTHPLPLFAQQLISCFQWRSNLS